MAVSAAFTWPRRPSWPRVAAVACAVYRDPSGAIIGSSETVARFRLDLPPGKADCSITVNKWLPVNFDESRTEVLLRCG
ncbi:hypothetical protein GCM10022255_085650 [Dactylosporangium darangshiense]|uniref:Uncharacterized protein n=1 Tax=Dactylosporangium darangshiense TaxID=579108 RepID=A0ABP8DMJ1_9ACTN